MYSVFETELKYVKSWNDEKSTRKNVKKNLKV